MNYWENRVYNYANWLIIIIYCKVSIEKRGPIIYCEVDIEKVGSIIYCEVGIEKWEPSDALPHAQEMWYFREKKLFLHWAYD